MFLQIYTIVFAQICISAASCTGPRMRRNAGGAYLLTNLSHRQELVQFVASLLKSDKLWKVLGFLASGLALDAASGLPLQKSLGRLQSILGTTLV